MDGTLLDSERIWDIALRELAHSLGGELSAAARAAMIGSNLLRSVGIVHDDIGVRADEAASGRFLLERTAELFESDLVWRPGGREIVEAVARAGIPAALVTATHRRLVEIALGTLGRRNFAATVCGDEVSEPKPSPVPYLRAAELLGQRLEDCVAIEDSPIGIASAEAAGCAVLAVPSEVPIQASATRPVRNSLVGLTVADLQAVVRARFPSP